MQDIMPQLGAQVQLVRSYGATGFRIGQDSYESHVLVLPTRTLSWSGELSLAALLPLLEATPMPEIFLIGTGARHEMLAPELRRALKERGVGVDSMDTGAACRTFNILLGEERRVAAALRLAV
ncbi:MAG: Mth938-like domain-containing protein [Alphaproteobacteria bacterium]|nr:Mth938-like domain-containing protein [Alphaproteobacteria bacterium]